MKPIQDSEISITWEKKGRGTIEMKTDEESLRAISKRAHDLTAGLRTVRFAVESVRDGYRFDDNLASAKIVALEKAVENLDRETKILSDLLRSIFD